jgi:hypothetical protein
MVNELLPLLRTLTTVSLGSKPEEKFSPAKTRRDRPLITGSPLPKSGQS